MLYYLHELQRSVMQPVTLMARQVAEAYSNSVNPLSYLPFAAETSASFELLERLGREYKKPDFNISPVQREGAEPVTITECIALKKSFCLLRHFQPSTPPARVLPVVLVCAPLSGHHATLLRDTVQKLLETHDVYITDWIDARIVPISEGVFHLDDYVAYLIEFMEYIGAKNEFHLISVCQPTVPALVAVSLMSAQKSQFVPRTMAMMGGPIDTRRNPTQVNALATTKSHTWFRNHVIYRVPSSYPGYMRMVYPGFLQHMGFVAMNPNHHLQSHWDFYEHLVRGDDESAEVHRKFYDEYNAVLDMDSDYYLDTIKMVFQEHALPKGTWVMGNTPSLKSYAGLAVDPSAIRDTALLTIEGELDDISGSGQTEAAHGLCVNIPAAHKQHYIAPQCGHYGIFSGRRWREMVYPKIKTFIEQHST